MRTFRQKVFVSYLILLLVFLALMFPFIANSVQQIVFRSMRDRSDTVIQKLLIAKDDLELVKILKAQKDLFFYRVGILDNERRLLYDSHTKRLLGPVYFPLQFITHPEIEEALEYGTGYSEEYSHLLEQKLIYVAKRFDFHGKPYVLRLAFPFQYIQDLREDLTIGFLFVSSLVLILFSAMAVLVLNHLASPIRKIIDAIRGFNEGTVETLPNIQLETSPHDDFTHLSNTINALSQRLKSEIELVTKERNDRDAILDGLSDGVIAVGRDTLVSYANKNALVLLNLNDDAIGKPFPQYILPQCSELLTCCQRENMLKSHPFEYGCGSNRRFLHLVALPRSSHEGAILVIQDTSLQQRVIEMRKAFIANASHELKTPITIIRGFAETLQDNAQGAVSLEQGIVGQIIDKIVSNCDRMTNIVKNLLTISDIENLPSFRLSATDVTMLLTKIIDTARPLYPDAMIDLQIGETSYILDADGDLLELAFSNLLDNAAKYSNGPAHIIIRLAQRTEFLEVSFQDHGIGIPEGDLKNIFQRFYRVDKAHSKKLGSSGLGLSIVETIITKHFGTIEVVSALGKGSTFTIKLPHRLMERLS